MGRKILNVKPWLSIVFHGTDSKPGYVTEVGISCGKEKIVRKSYEGDRLEARRMELYKE